MRIGLVAVAGLVLLVLLAISGALDAWLPGSNGDAPAPDGVPIQGEEGVVALEGRKDAGAPKPMPLDASLPPPVDLEAVDRQRDVHGIVVQADGTPVPGAQLQVITYPARRGGTLDSDGWDRPHAGKTTVSARDGTFALAVRSGTKLSLEVRATGFATMTVVSLQPGERVRVVMQPAVALVILTQGADKQPLAEVSVEVTGRSSDYSARCRADSVTDADGLCAFEDLPAGMLVRVEAKHGVMGGFKILWDSLTLPAAGELKHVLVIPKGRVVTGRVTDARTQRPVAGARVGLGWTFFKETRTDEDGRYALGGYTGDGYVDINVQASGYAWEGKRVGIASTLDFELQPGFSVTGRVVAPGSAPLADVRVAAVGSAFRRGKQVISVAHGTSDAQGRFRLNDLRRDLVHALVLTPEGFGRHLVRVDKPAERLEQVDVGDVEVPAGITVRGRVLDAEGKALSRAQVSLNGPLTDDDDLDDDYGRDEDRMTDDLGRFAFADIAPGKYVLTAGGYGESRTTRSITVEAGAKGPEFVLRFEARRSLRVEVVDQRDKPIPNVTIYAMPLGAGEVYGQTNAEGAVTLNIPLHVRWVQLMVFQDSDAYLSVDETQVAADVERHRIVLKDAALCRGTLLDDKGKPLHRAHVEARRDGVRLGSASTDAEGAFKVRVPPGGIVDLVYRGDVYVIDEGNGWRVRRRTSFEALQERVPVGGEPVVLRARPIPNEAALTVRTLDVDGTPLPGVQVRLDPAPFEGRGRAVSDEQGLVTFEQLTKHPLVVNAVPPKAEKGRLAPKAAKNIVPAGQTLDLRFEPPVVLEGVVVDQQGEPVARASVSSNNVFAGQQPSTKTDEDGHFRLTVPPDFDGLLTLWAYVKDTEGVTLAANMGGVDPAKGPVRLVVKPNRGW